jgi:hypothetical protein
MTMSGFHGSLAVKLDFGDVPTAVTSTGAGCLPADRVAVQARRPGGQAGLRLAPTPGRLTGPDKYRVLERRRRQAQIAARHLLALMGTE